MLVGTGGTTGLPKGVMLTARNLETMTALTLMGYPFSGRPAYLALAPLTHAAGVLCFPVMALGGRIVVMRAPDLGRFLALIERRADHPHVPAADADLHAARARGVGSDRPLLAAVLLVRRGADVDRPAGGGDRGDRARDGAAVRPDRGADDGLDAARRPSTSTPTGASPRERLASAGRPGAAGAGRDHGPGPGTLLPDGERGEIVVRSSLVMAGYYKDPEATAAASRFGWHHTGDIGYLDDDGYLFIVDRLKDMIITGGFNVYSAEVEQALMQHPAVRDCAVIGLPDEKWGERVTAVVELKPGAEVERRRADRVRQGADRQREGAQARRAVARAAALARRQGAQDRGARRAARCVRALTLP